MADIDWSVVLASYERELAALDHKYRKRRGVLELVMDDARGKLEDQQAQPAQPPSKAVTE